MSAAIFGRILCLGGWWLGAACLLLGGLPLHAATNGIVWSALEAPGGAVTGDAVVCRIRVTNTGERPWGEEHFVEVTDESGVVLRLIALGLTPPGDTRDLRIPITLPAQRGNHTYRFQALHHGQEYFGPIVEHTLLARHPAIPLKLTLDRTEVFEGERTLVRSTVGPEGRGAAHGIEGRVLGGAWQVLAEWSGESGRERTAFAIPPASGIYELRAYAERADDAEPSYSPRLMLLVSVIPPVITAHPAATVATVGEAVTLSVGASGESLAFQWTKNGVLIPGATTAGYTLASAHVTDSGSYSVLVSNRGGSVVTQDAAIAVHPVALPETTVSIWSFPAGGPARPGSASTARVGDVVSLRSGSTVKAGHGWQHNLLVRRPGVTAADALAPEDGSGISGERAAWNRDGWGSPHAATFDPRMIGSAATDLGRREPFIHALEDGQADSSRAVDFVLDAPGVWLLRAEVVDAEQRVIAASGTTSLHVTAPVLVADPAAVSYPYGRDDRFVGVYWNAGQAHRLWSTWRAEFQRAYPATWAVNWQLMWQPSPYFRRIDGGWLAPGPAADSPWQPFWSAHQVYALVPDAAAGSRLSHDLTSQSFAERAAVRLMDIGVDFVAVDYTNQFLEPREDVLPALHNLALAFQTTATRTPSGQRIKLTAVAPANVESGDWAGSGGFGSVGIARFNAKLTTLYERYARFESAWFYLEDDDGARKPLLLLWVGAGGETEPDGKLAPARLAQLRLADGRALADVFTLRWVGAYLADNRRFLTGSTYTVNTSGGPVTGQHANAKFWSYHEHFPSTATIASTPAASGGRPAIEAITVQPLAAGRDRFGRPWMVNWPAGQGYHYETPVTRESVPLAGYGRIWHDTLETARALNPKFLLTTWAEFGSENDEPRPEMSVTIMDNNKFGTHFGDAFKQAVRLFKYKPPSAWVDVYSIGADVHTLADLPSTAIPVVRNGQTLTLQGWVNPNVATAFAGGSVKIFVNDVLQGTAAIGGARGGATRWVYELAAARLPTGRHTVKVLAEDGVGGSSLAGVQFRDTAPQSALTVVVVP